MKFELIWTKSLPILLLLLSSGASYAAMPEGVADPCLPFSPQEFLESICGSIHDIDRLHGVLNLLGVLPKAKRSNCGIRHERYDVCSSCDDNFSPRQIQALQEIFSEPRHEEHHADWHAIRLEYIYASSQQRQKWESSGQLDFPDGTDPMDHVYGPPGPDGLRTGGRLTGEDFLFMHREMIKMEQIQLAARGLGCIAPWKELPASVDDPKYPVPQVYALHGKPPNQMNAAGGAFRELIKNAGTAWKVDIGYAPVGIQLYYAQQVLQSLQKLDRVFRDPRWLKTHTLNDLGNQIDVGTGIVSFHAALHALYDSHDFCVLRSSNLAQNCASMSDFHFSAENPYFWKIHGLIDEYLDLWLDANGYTEVSRDCGQPARAGCYQWKGTWSGQLPFSSARSSR